MSSELGDINSNVVKEQILRERGALEEIHSEKFNSTTTVNKSRQVLYKYCQLMPGFFQNSSLLKEIHYFTESIF